MSSSSSSIKFGNNKSIRISIVSRGSSCSTVSIQQCGDRKGAAIISKDVGIVGGVGIGDRSFW